MISGARVVLGGLWLHQTRDRRALRGRLRVSHGQQLLDPQFLHDLLMKDMVKYPPTFFWLSEISCSHKFTGLYHFTFQKIFFWGIEKNPIFRSTSNRGDGIVTYHSSSWESRDDFFKAKGCQIWGISWGKSGK